MKRDDWLPIPIALVAVGVLAVAIHLGVSAYMHKPIPGPDWSLSCEQILAEEPPSTRHLGRWMRCLRDNMKDLQTRLSELEKKQ